MNGRFLKPRFYERYLIMGKSPLSLALSPGGQVYIDRHPDNNEFLDAHKANKIHALFDNDHATGLLHLDSLSNHRLLICAF
jgi:hypothetical protein